MEQGKKMKLNIYMIDSLINKCHQSSHLKLKSQRRQSVYCFDLLYFVAILSNHRLFNILTVVVFHMIKIVVFKNSMALLVLVLQQLQSFVVCLLFTIDLGIVNNKYFHFYMKQLKCQD